MDQIRSDLHVEQLSESLLDKSIDVIVSGSIGAIEAPKMIRWLRRFGAKPNVYLTDGGSKFITKTSLEWAAASPVHVDWSSAASHVATSNALIVTPASANFIAKSANGITDSPALALFSSHLGNGSKILMLPNMHRSMAESPLYIGNKATLEKWVRFLQPRVEEGKNKFPDPEQLANEISHYLNKDLVNRQILLTAGGTYTDIDIARHIGNKSTGRLGSHVAEELYRRGFGVDVILGTHQFSPKSATSITNAPRFEDMAEQMDSMSNATYYDAIICAAAISDFSAEDSSSNSKISSTSNSPLTLKLSKTPKLLSRIKGRSNCTVGFKFLGDQSKGEQDSVARDYIEEYDLDSLIVNFAGDISPANHSAYAYTKTTEENKLGNRSAIAGFIADRALSHPSRQKS